MGEATEAGEDAAEIGVIDSLVGCGLGLGLPFKLVEAVKAVVVAVAVVGVAIMIRFWSQEVE